MSRGRVYILCNAICRGGGVCKVGATDHWHRGCIGKGVVGTVRALIYYLIYRGENKPKIIAFPLDIGGQDRG